MKLETGYNDVAKTTVFRRVDALRKRWEAADGGWHDSTSGGVCYQVRLRNSLVLYTCTAYYVPAATPVERDNEALLWFDRYHISWQQSASEDAKRFHHLVSECPPDRRARL